MRRASPAAIAAATVALMAAPASAYVCSRAVDASGGEMGSSLSWFERDLTYTLHADGTAVMAGDAELDVLRAAFAVWVGVRSCSSPQVTSDITFTETAWTSRVDRVGYDYLAPDANENLMIFRDGGWPLPGQSDIIALTTVTYTPLTGEIVDGDVEFNSDPSGPTAGCPFGSTGSPRMDLMNVAVHEIGHVLGLAHTNVPGATMIGQGRCDETEKATLECDDRDAVVFKYPASGPRGYCEPTASCGYCAPPGELTRPVTISLDSPDDGMGGCGCSGTGAPLWAALAVAALFARRRRHEPPPAT